MDSLAYWLAKITTVLFFVGLLGCFIVIPRTAIALVMAARDQSDKDD